MRKTSSILTVEILIVSAAQLKDLFPLSFSRVFIQTCLIGGKRQPAGCPVR